MVVRSPPVPKWQPSFGQPIEQIVERLRYYTNQKRDFAVFQNGTCALVDGNLSDQAVELAALETLSKIFNYHPDMTPTPMDDGNLVVQYRHSAVNVVLTEVAQKHWEEIEARHRDGLATSEVLMTPQGQNVFDDLGKKALLGRCYMFLDAQSPRIVRIERAGA